MLAVVRRRAHARRARHIGGVTTVMVLAAGVLAAAAFSPNHASVRTTDGPARTTTSTTATGATGVSSEATGTPVAGPGDAPPTSTTPPTTPAPTSSQGTVPGVDATTI